MAGQRKRQGRICPKGSWRGNSLSLGFHFPKKGEGAPHKKEKKIEGSEEKVQ